MTPSIQLERDMQAIIEAFPELGEHTLFQVMSHLQLKKGYRVETAYNTAVVTHLTPRYQDLEKGADFEVLRVEGQLVDVVGNVGQDRIESYWLDKARLNIEGYRVMKKDIKWGRWRKAFSDETALRGEIGSTAWSWVERYWLDIGVPIVDNTKKGVRL